MQIIEQSHAAGRVNTRFMEHWFSTSRFGNCECRGVDTVAGGGIRQAFAAASGREPIATDQQNPTSNDETVELLAVAS